MNEGETTQPELTGRTALVTGAGRGIGRAVAEELAGRGARLMLVGRTLERLAEVERRIRETGGEARSIPADLADTGWLESLEAPVDLVVHGAAAFASYARIEEVDDEEVGRVLDVSLRAAFRLTARVLPGMKERGFGRIVFLGSLAGSLGAHGQAAYAAAKAGLEGLMRSVALEGATSGITANLLELGLIDTERVREAVDPRAIERIVERTPVGRIGLPGEVADAVAFLASPRASYITGVVLPVSGGLGLGLYPEQLG